MIVYVYAAAADTSAVLCLGDEDLRREIESLISYQELAQNFLGAPAVEENLYLLCEPQLESMIGRTLGRYKIEAQLGVGGMGEVYLAEDSKLDQKVAIKFLSSCLQPSLKAKERLLLEAKALAQLDHPNICRVIDVKEEDNLSFIVMQYIAGETLADRLKKNPLSLHETLNITIQVLEALSEAHSVGIVHRDIKPGNIMITPRGQVKVLDFGLVKLVGSIVTEVQARSEGQSFLSRTGEFAGTPPYMSPEQAAGAPVDARSDLFAVGVILYECLTGTRPFSGNTEEKILKQVRQLHPAPPSRLKPHLPPELDKAILRALAKIRDARYQSADEFLVDLREICATVEHDENQSTKPLPAHSELRTRSMVGTITTTLRQPAVSISTLAIVTVVVWLFITNPLRPAPLSPEAVNWYDQGVAALREGAYYKASTLLEQAIKRDDRFALAHARLAEAYAELDHTDKAKDEIIRAESLVNELSLNPAEQLYLKATTRTILRDFGPAIDNYRQLLREASQSDKAHVYLDLGKAYEKNDQLTEARDQYLEALKLAPQDAAVSLRLGIICGQLQDLNCANESFQKAETLYTAQGNFEGVTEVRFERGFLFLNMEDTKHARGDLESALQRSKTSNNVYQQIKALQALSSVSAIDGENNLAEQRATAAIALARANGIENQVTAGLIWLGNHFLAAANNFDEAEKYYRRALDLAERDKLRLHEAWAQFQLGSLFLSRHKTLEALRYLDQALPFYQRGGYRRYLSWLSMLRGRALRNTGDYDAALKAFNDVLQLVQQLGDQAQVAAAHEEIGSVLLLQERYPEALSSFAEACNGYNAMSLTVYAGYCEMHRATALWQIGRYNEARASLTGASSVAQKLNKKLLLASAELTEAFIELSEQHDPQARTHARKATDLADKEFSLTATQAQYLLALTQLHSGASRAAKQSSQTAADMALATEDPSLISAAQLVQAEVALDSRDARGALQLALQTQKSFERLGQKDSEWRAWLIAARASQQLGDKAAMSNYAANANKRLGSLENQWGPEAFNGYSSRKDIQRSRKELEQLTNPNLKGE